MAEACLITEATISTETNIDVITPINVEPTIIEPALGSNEARPLKVLVPLIQDDVRHGKEAAAAAGLPYYRAAGEKLLEAKSQLKHGEFKSWVSRNVAVSHKQATFYMKLAKDAADRDVKKLPPGNFSSLSDFIRKTSSPTQSKPTARPNTGTLTKREADPGAAIKAIEAAVASAREDADVIDETERHLTEYDRLTDRYCKSRRRDDRSNRIVSQIVFHFTTATNSDVELALIDFGALDRQCLAGWIRELQVAEQRLAAFRARLEREAA